MNLLAAIASFIKVVESGSIVGAAKILGVSAAAVSQTINRLEAHLGVRLLQRTTRSMALTENGAVYYEKVRRIAADLEAAQSSISSDDSELQGRLSIASTSAFGRHVLAALIAGFAALHPRLLIELSTSNGKINHIQDGIDLSLRITPQLEDGIVARKIVSLPFIMCAAPAYLQRAGWPQSPDDLQNHACLAFRYPWTDVFCAGRLLATASVSTPLSMPPPSVMTSMRWRKWRFTAPGSRDWRSLLRRLIWRAGSWCRCLNTALSSRWTSTPAYRNGRR
jgi:DNA-binding transcriptional LysR family regulator